MFVYTDEELIAFYKNYPQRSRLLKGIMRFVVISALPLLTEAEKRKLDRIKQAYDALLEQLPEKSEKEKEEAAQRCLKTVYQAIRLYDRSFDRLADQYFSKIYN